MPLTRQFRVLPGVLATLFAAACGPNQPAAVPAVAASSPGAPRSPTALPAPVTPTDSASPSASPPAAPAPGERYVPDTGSRVRVNQVGYLPSGPKGATLVTSRAERLPWQLIDRAGRVVARGLSEPRGIDASSGLNVHELRFDRVVRRGVGFTLEADGERSYPFDIGADVYANLRVDSLALFYLQRSGTAIQGAIAGAPYAREAGHLGRSPNAGDTAVPCLPAELSRPIYAEPWTCGYTLDAQGGWYDAGDHGKYVVGGGIAVAQLLTAYERSLNAPSTEAGALGDGSLRLPERGNGVPDILDEARWELEWLLRMQVPSDQPLAGMAHHKLHDREYTRPPLAPADDPQPRFLHRPSTAATLNLAAVAAQGARLYKRYDAAFAARLLDAARAAWQAALEHPALYAPAGDADGGGPYDDSDASDELYWAAAELYITTHEPAFRAALAASPHATGSVFELDGFDWGHVAAFARLGLATSRVQLDGRDAIVRSVLAAADALVSLARAQAWGQPYAPATGVWVWGSNFQLLNNLMVLATAYDLSGRERYRRLVLEGVDYLFGRNALNRSYVTGYGDHYSQNQHSRLYSAQLDPRSPHPPPGTLAGGPNTNLQDPLAQSELQGCIGQFCYMDDIYTASTNELAIYWNSALAWVASFLANQGSREGVTGR